MTETDTTEITTRSQLQTRDNESLPRATEEHRWIHDTSAARLPTRWPTNRPGSSGKTA